MEHLIWQCQAAIDGNGGVLLSLFLAGLLGSVNHCAGMCGPFVLTMVPQGGDGAGAETGPAFLSRARGAFLLPYHLGRVTTYVFLGVIGAGLSQFMIGSPMQRTVAGLLMFSAGLLFLFSAIPSFRQLLIDRLHLKSAGSFFSSIPFGFGRFVGVLARPFIGRSAAGHQYLLGIMLGFMPCALVIAAIMAVTATGAPVVAALAMAFFGLGTIPALIGVGVVGQAVSRKWPHRMQQALTGVMAVNGAGLIILAGGMVR